MSSTPDRLFNEFVEAWNAGARPDLDDYLARAGTEEERAELAALARTFLSVAPTPSYDDDALRRIRERPAVARARAAARAPGGLAAAMLANARHEAALSTEQLADAVGEEVGIAADRRAKAREYLERLERGRLDAGGLSQRLVDALSRILGVGGELFGAPRPASAAPAFRADSAAAAEAASDLELLGRGLALPSAEEWDEVDELFCGGR